MFDPLKCTNEIPMEKEILDQLRKSLPKHYGKLLRKKLRGAKKSVSIQYISMVMNGTKTDHSIIQAAVQLKAQLEEDAKKLKQAITGEGEE